MSTRAQLAAARIQGSAAAFAHLGRISADEALAQITAEVANLPAAQRQAVLDEAASHYVSSEPDGWYYPAALLLLVAAGASEQQARAIDSARVRTRGLSGLGEQAGRS